MTYEEWSATPEGTMMLVITQKCDTFAEADKVLRAAFKAGGRSDVPKSGGDFVSVPREVLDFFNFASTIFVPFTSQQQELQISLMKARDAMTAANLLRYEGHKPLHGSVDHLCACTTSCVDPWRQNTFACRVARGQKQPPLQGSSTK